MAIEAVIFDIGGVLEITAPTGWPERWAADLGLEPGEMEERLAAIFAHGMTGAITLTDVERQIAHALDLDRASVDALLDDLWSEYLGTLNDHLARYFAGLRPRYRTGILSNSFVGARERERAAYGLEELCDVVVYSHEEGRAKPDPGFYRTVCQRLGVRPDQAVFLDDVQAYVDGARAAGMTAVRFVSNEQAIGELTMLLSGPGRL